MSDVEWAVIRVEMPVPGWLEGRGGQPEGYCHRQLADAVRYLVAGGIAWRAMPADFPAWDRVYAFFRRRRDTGLVAELHDRLRDRVRVAAGRDQEPTAGIIDTQSVKAAASVPAASRGFAGGKNVNGRKRHIVVDTLGLLLTVVVTAGSVTDREAGGTLLARLRERRRRITIVWADGGYTRTPGRLCPRRPEPRSDRVQTHQQYRRVHRPAQEMVGRADVRVADAPTPPRARLRESHRDLGGDDPLLDEHGHEPPPRQAVMLIQDRVS
ncbi:IS5 family transposase [Streptomyces sp. NPDC021020]|uniref:IS5 family transposase n=1 Tax=Streptomyces sp. NPDC021020 TaxID=3365109 RepID=UPI003798A667